MIIQKAEQLFNKEFNCPDECLRAISNHVGEWESVKQGLEWVKGCGKYTWKADFVAKWDEQTIIMFSLEAIGNGGWQSIDETKIVGVHQVRGTRLLPQPAKVLYLI